MGWMDRLIDGWIFLLFRQFRHRTSVVDNRELTEGTTEIYGLALGEFQPPKYHKIKLILLAHKLSTIFRSEPLGLRQNDFYRYLCDLCEYDMQEYTLLNCVYAAFSTTIIN